MSAWQAAKHVSGKSCGNSGLNWAKKCRKHTRRRLTSLLLQYYSSARHSCCPSRQGISSPRHTFWLPQRTAQVARRVARRWRAFRNTSTGQVVGIRRAGWPPRRLASWGQASVTRYSAANAFAQYANSANKNGGKYPLPGRNSENISKSSGAGDR